ncbi:MAG TPA: monovalent cation:proton antiporter family protein [Bacteroidales bacterium]|nr:monovalent cation:proton antiporter family protein [Bacteroidales bacterium]
MELGLLKAIVIIFALSTVVNYVFSKIKVPTILGYLMTGIIAGPYALGIIGEHNNIKLVSEIGVVMLLFSIGIEFSLNHLLKIRKIVFLGGFLQLVFTVVVTMFIARMYELQWKGSLFMGFLVALSSTAIVLKILQERSELTSNYGRTVLGILIFQDLLLVPLLLFTPILGGQHAETGSLWFLALKAVAIVVFIYVGNRWLMPRLLHAIALTKNQELFMMALLLICLSVAFLTAKMGMSLAFGAFLAGLMISDTDYSQSAFGNLIPLKDLFVSFFFISVGILLDLRFVADHPGLVILTVFLVVFFKSILASTTAFLLGHTFRGTIMVGIALSQVGEFSFLLASLGLTYSLLTPFHYQLFLAVAVISMALTPLLMKFSRPFSEFLLRRLNLPKKVVEGIFPLPEIDIPEIRGHLVFIGKDSRALNLAKMARQFKLPYVSVIFDPEEVRKRQLKGEHVVYGDAVNEPILLKAYTDKADIVVISIGNMITAMAVIENVRTLNANAYIIVRTKRVEDIEDLYAAGANKVIPEEFETSIELFDRVLAKLLIPRREIDQLINRIRNDNYGIFQEKNGKSDLATLKDLANIEITAVKVDDRSPVIGKSLVEMQLRNTYGVTIAAMVRRKELYDNPDPETLIEKGDLVYLMGRPENILDAATLFEKKRPVSEVMTKSIES